MNPKKVNRKKLEKLTDLPNIGPASAKDLLILGYTCPQNLIGADPIEMYSKLCEITNSIHDPCVIDVFISIVRFMNGDEPKNWWEYTDERKSTLNKLNLMSTDKLD